MTSVSLLMGMKLVHLTRQFYRSNDKIENVILLGTTKKIMIFNMIDAFYIIILY